MTSRRKLGGVGTRLLFENERVKIWELDLEPGQSSSWHHHTLDYITVSMDNSTMRREFEDGATDETNPQAGQPRYAVKHQPHVVTNIGSNRHRNVLIELKE